MTAAMRSATLQCAARLTSCEALLVQRLSDLRSHRWLTTFFLTATRLGDGPLWWGLGVALVSWGGPAGRLAAAASGAAVAASILLFLGLKRFTLRPRPFEVWCDLPCLAAPPDRFSFPSGHTMTAFAVWSAVAELMPAASPVLFAVAVWIGLSRIFLGLHYPTDVLAGGVLGSALGSAAAFWLSLGLG